MTSLFGSIFGGPPSLGQTSTSGSFGTISTSGFAGQITTSTTATATNATSGPFSDWQYTQSLDFSDLVNMLRRQAGARTEKRQIMYGGLPTMVSGGGYPRRVSNLAAKPSKTTVRRYANRKVNEIISSLLRDVQAVDMRAFLGEAIDYHAYYYEAARQEGVTEEGVILDMGDGSYIEMFSSGGYAVHDQDAKVVYRANSDREFNRFINASDLLADFIRHLGKLGVRQDQFLDLPIELFINWLVVQAAEKDGDPMPDFTENPRCRECGRFIPDETAKAGVLLCEPHLMIFMERKKLPGRIG